MDTMKTIQSILSEIKPTKDLNGINDIVEGGYLDSFELMSLISRLSDVFQIEIGFEEITPENFNSVEAICGMVQRLAEVQ